MKTKTMVCYYKFFPFGKCLRNPASIALLLTATCDKVNKIIIIYNSCGNTVELNIVVVNTLFKPDY